MLSFDSSASAAANAEIRGAAWLVELFFTTGTKYFTTWPTDIAYGGNTYLGFGRMVGVGEIAETEDTDSSNIVLRFALTDTAMLAAALGNVHQYRGRQVNMRLQLMDATLQPAGDPVLRWSGVMQPLRVVRTPPGVEGDGAVGYAELPCLRSGMERVRLSPGMRLTDAQQRDEFAGDLGCEYIAALIEKPQPWLSVKFQEI